MQITIDTERDDLLQVSRVINVLLGTGTEHSGPITRIDMTGQPYDGEKLAEVFNDVANNGREKELHTSGPVQQLVEDADAPPPAEPYPEAAAVFGNVKGASLFDAEPGKPHTQAAAAEADAATEAEETVGANGELDAAGTPWDERIHASTKTKVADGTWKKKRGVDPELYAAVIAEYSADEDYEERQEGPKPAAPVAVEPPAAPSIPDAEPTGGAPVSPPPPPPVAPPAPPVGELDWPSFVRLVTSKSGGVSAADIAAACQAEGIASFPQLQQQPDKIPAVAKRLGLA